MAHVAPEGGVYQAGTLSGNPLATTAGLVMLRALDDGVYRRIAEATRRLCAGLAAAAAEHGVTVTVNQVCGMFSLFFTGSRVTEFDHVANTDVSAFNRFFHAMLDEGVYLAPSAFEAAFVSAAHDDEVVGATIAAAGRAFAALGT
jgi:glutamate-1-semialdehyde 2,1-aminomutase